MPFSIPLNNDPHAYDTRIELGGVVYLTQVRWNWRSGDWRISMQNTLTGSYVATSRRISSGTMCVRLPLGAIFAFGADPYPKEALGDTLYLIYYTDEELTALQTAEALGADPTFALV